MKFRNLKTGFLAAFLAILNLQVVSYAQNQPNIILIMADDLGYGDVGFNGNEIIKTPELDKMATQGLVFDRFYAAAPICSPTRGSCLTGRHPFRYGVLAAHSGGMRAGEITIAEILKENGYRTGFFGKWHLGYVRPDAEQEDRGYYSPPWHHGFDLSFVTKSAVPTWNPSVTPPGWNAWNNYDGEIWSSSMYVMNGDLVQENLKGDDSRVIMDRAIPFIENTVQENRPFFTCIWFHTPHEPVVAGSEYKALYSEYTDDAQNYYGAITAMDEQIGRLRNKLKQLGIDKNTILWFTSDNGPSGHLVKPGIASAGKYRGSKHTVYEGGLRMPTVLEWSGKIMPGRTTYMSGTVDFLPTLVALAKVNFKFDDRPMEGINIEEAIFNNAKERPSPMAFGWMRLWANIKSLVWTDNRYKLITYELKNQIELYDLIEDPSETNNLAAEKKEKVQEMKKKLDEWEKSCQLSRDGRDYRY